MQKALIVVRGRLKIRDAIPSFPHPTRVIRPSIKAAVLSLPRTTIQKGKSWLRGSPSVGTSSTNENLSHVHVLEKISGRAKQ